VIPILLACTAAEEPPKEPGTVRSETTVTTPEGVPWVAPPEDLPAVDLDAVLAVAQEGIDLAPALSPEPVLAAYRDLAAAADTGCPAMYEVDGFAYWLDSCTSGAGTRFDGYGLDDEVALYEPGYDTYDYSATGGAGSIEAADGTFLDMDGYAQLVEASADGVLVTSLVLTGDFATNHPAAAGTWVERGLRPNFVATVYEAAGLRLAFSVVGAIDGLGGDYPAVAFDDAIWVDPSFGYGGCAEEPAGAVSVRLASGEWVDVVFDPTFVDDLVVYEEGTCDGCGTAWLRDEKLGEACLDFSGW
jgi:hypothetical protein